MSNKALRPPRNGPASLDRRGGKPRPERTLPFDCNRVLLQAVMLGVAFYAGLVTGMHAASGADCNAGLGNSPNGLRQGNGVDDAKIEAIVEQRLRIELARVDSGTRGKVTSKGGRPEPRFPSKFATGIMATDKNEFIDIFDYGTPERHVPSSSSKVMILYSSRSALPADYALADAAMYDNGAGIPSVGAADATANCATMNVVVLNERGTNQCVAVMDGYDSYHLQRWMRVGRTGGLDISKPLVHVGRGLQSNGREQFSPPDRLMRKRSMEMVKRYLTFVDSVVRKLRPVAKSVAQKNTIIVLVCNKGQSDLLLNFACNAEARNLDISNALVFATDQETHDIATGVGMTAFYDESLFGKLPLAEAKKYGDRIFTGMMYAKVVSVHLVTLLDYDVLFQDVDVVWYKNPLEIFHDETSPFAHFDVLFQDDGARSLRYAPYSANSGFYYVRSNRKTQHLFTSLIYTADVILKTQSHQQALGALLAEHSSLYGLKVKTLNGDDFPGGYHYHRSRDLMNDIIRNKKTPWLFHMSWTENKYNKILFFKQMGLWYITEHCEGGKAVDEVRNSGNIKSCCSVEPLVSCHYKDKPSMIPCNDSPTIDKRGRSFWN